MKLKDHKNIYRIDIGNKKGWIVSHKQSNGYLYEKLFLDSEFYSKNYGLIRACIYHENINMRRNENLKGVAPLKEIIISGHIPSYEKKKTSIHSIICNSKLIKYVVMWWYDESPYYVSYETGRYGKDKAKKLAEDKFNALNRKHEPTM